MFGNSAIYNSQWQGDQGCPMNMFVGARTVKKNEYSGEPSCIRKAITPSANQITESLQSGAKKKRSCKTLHKPESETKAQRYLGIPGEPCRPKKRHAMHILHCQKGTPRKPRTGRLICSTTSQPYTLSRSGDLPNQPNKQSLRRNLQRPQTHLSNPLGGPVSIRDIARESLVRLPAKVVQ